MGIGAFMAAHEAARRNNNGMRRRDDYGGGNEPVRRNSGEWQPERNGWTLMENRNRRTNTERTGTDNRNRVYRGENRENRGDRRQEREDGYHRRAMEDDWEDEEDDEEGGEDEKYEMTKAKAMEWVEGMENEDPAHPHGARWTMEDVKPLAAKHGIKENTTEFVEFWATMNMLYSDYYNMLKEYNIANGEAVAKMARAFLRDKDAMDHKLGRYYCAVVKK